MWLYYVQQGKGGDEDYEPGSKKIARKPKPKKRKTEDDDDSDEDWGKKKKVNDVSDHGLFVSSLTLLIEII